MNANEGLCKGCLRCRSPGRTTQHEAQMGAGATAMWGGQVSSLSHALHECRWNVMRLPEVKSLRCRPGLRSEAVSCPRREGAPPCMPTPQDMRQDVCCAGVQWAGRVRPCHRAVRMPVAVLLAPSPHGGLVISPSLRTFTAARVMAIACSELKHCPGSKLRALGRNTDSRTIFAKAPHRPPLRAAVLTKCATAAGLYPLQRPWGMHP